MAKTKEISSSKKQFAKGGSGKMFGQQGAKPAKGGEIALSQGGKGEKFAKGGGGKMFGYAPAAQAKAGITSAR